MTLLELGALGELVGGVAIVISLIYVGLQIKQNTNAQRLSTAHRISEDLADLYLTPASSNDLADIFMRGLTEIDALDGTDRLRFYGFLHKFFRTNENAHYQFTHGALESEAYEGITEQFRFIASTPGGRIYWQDRRSWYSGRFQDYVDTLIAMSDGESMKLAGT